MKFEVYCDETLPDLFTSQHPGGRYLMIGSLWLPAEMRGQAKARIADLRQKHGVDGEIKWRKISPAKQAFFIDLDEELRRHPPCCRGDGGFRGCDCHQPQEGQDLEGDLRDLLSRR